MKTNFNKPNPKRLLGYLMAFAMVFFTTTSIAQNAVTITVGGSNYASEVSWDLTDASGAILVSGVEGTYSATLNVDADCYNMNMADSYGDGWDFGSYTITDDVDGTVYATGTCAGAFQTDNFCPVAPVACADNAVTSAATDSWPSENSFDITDCDGNVIISGAPGYDDCIALGAVYSVNLYDSFGDGGGSVTIDGTTYTLATGSTQSWQVGACPVLGCTDATAANYNAAADTDDGSCTYGVPGCVDALACNYDASATADDGSCTYAADPLDCAGNCANGGDALTLNLVDSWGDGWNGNILTVDGVDYTIASGASASFTLCMDLTVCSDITYTVVGSFSYPAENSWNVTDASGNVLASGGANSDVLGTCVGGCTDATAFNYDALADFDDASCVAVVNGCMDSTAANYDATANTDDGSCTYGVPGCVDALACNYDTSATADDGSCTYALAGYDCAGACLSGEEVTLTLLDSFGDGGGSVTINGDTYTLAAGSSQDFVFCMDLSVCTDIIYAATDSWSSENSWTLSDASGAVVASGANNSGIVGNTPGFDCAGACLTGDLVTVTLYDSFGDGGGQITVDGNVLTNSGTSNSMSICVDLSVCTDITYASTDSWPYENSWDVVDASGAVIASGADASGNVGACAVLGCTDPAASNYDPAANTDDGSCTFCTDNYVTISCDGGMWQTEVSWTLTNSAGTVVATGGAPYAADVCLPSDCYTVDMADSFGDGWNGNIFDISMGGVSVGTGTLTGGAAGSADIAIGAICYVYGCTDANAVNYDAAATADDGSCAYSCTAAPYCENFDLGVGTWTNNGWQNLSGSTGSTGTGPTDDITGGAYYMYFETSGAPAASIDITSECLDISSLAAPALSFYNHMFGGSIGTLSVYVNGDTLWTMSGDQGDQWNFVQVDLSAYASLDVTIMIEATYGGSFTGDIAIDEVCVGELLVIDGCTDPTATNYNPAANNDDGSCTFCTDNWVTVSFYDSFGDGWNGATMNVSDYTTGDSITSGTLGGGSFYTDDICLADGCYEVVVGGGTWDAEITFDFGSLLGAPVGSYLVSVGAATCPILGCTDPTALNFDSIADTDDGSCAYLCDVYVASASVDAAPSCNGAFDASATCYIAGSFGGDFYQWNDPNGQTSSTAIGLAAGTYTCTVTDSVNGCTSVATVVIDPTPVISITAFVADATPNNTNGSVDLTVSGGTPCYNGSAMSLAGAASTSTQWASNVFDVVATSDLQITSIDQPSMAGIGTANVYYRLGSAAGFEADATGWMLVGSAPVLANFTGDISNIPVSINVNAGETISIYVQGVGVNVVFGAGVDSTYNSVVSSDANLSIIGGFATGGAPGSGTTLPSAGSFDFGGNINYSLSSYTYAWSNGASSEDASGLGLGPISVTVTDCNGCTASWTGFVLTNYVYGCLDTLAANYDAAANTSWDQDTTGATPACIYPGCIDVLANNFDASANQDDGSCTYSCAYYGWDDALTITMTPDWFSSEVSWYIIDAVTGDTALSSVAYANGGAVDVVELCANNGCYYVDGYDSFGDGWTSGSLDIVDNSGNSLVSGFTLGSATTFATSPIFSVGGANCGAGCTDTAFVNFDVNAVIDDGSCSDSIVGCTDATASNYTPFSNYDDGSCCYDNTISITVDGGSWQGEVGWSIVASDGTVITTGGAPFAGDVCLADDCYTVDMTDSFGDGWNGNVFTASSGGAVIGSGGLTSGAAGSFTFAVGSATCDVFGCSDSAASNYDASVTIDDGTCCYDQVLVIETGLEVTPGDLEFGDWSNWVGGWNVTLAGDTNIVLEGSDNTGFGFLGDDNSGCFPEGCYEFNATGTSNGGWAWFNINGTQYDGPVNGGAYGAPSSTLFTLGNAVCPVYGCMDSTAVNYDAAADTDDGSCAYPCLDNEIAFNMYDAFGDGWNGGTYTVTDVSSGTVVANGGLASGAFELGTLCLVDGCYNITVGGGTWDSEITFDFDTLLVSAPAGSYDVYLGTGACPIFGCMDSTAVNYDPLADTDDGSCILACQTAPYCETFDAGVPADWTNNGWTLNAGATGSFGTGPSDDYTGGGNYMYYETSGLAAGTPAITLTSLCLDISGLTTPTLSFYNHMLGASMGTLDVLVNGTNVWSQSGDQGDVWNFAQVDLSTYAGSTNITIDFVGNYGTSFTGDMAIDEVCVDEYLVIDGCTDPTALNYDPNANNDDGSCNYCTLDNVTLNLYDSWGDGWNGGIMTVNGVDYTVASGSLASFDLCVDLTTCTDLIYTAGSFTAENSWDVVDASGAVIASGPNASGTIGAGCPVYGCTDTTAANYDPSADTDDGSCDYLGCTNPTAVNYDATATIDDGSCTFGCTDNTVNITAGGGAWDSEISWDIVDGSGTVIASGIAGAATTLCIVDDCYTVNMYDSFGDGWNGGIITLDDGAGNVLATDGLTAGASGSFTVQVGSTVSCAVLGCTDAAASNYDATATVDDGSCTYPCLLDAVTLNLYDSYGDGGQTMTVDGVDYSMGSGFGAPGSSISSFDLCIDLTVCTDLTYTNTDGYPSENTWTVTDASGAIIASGGSASGTVGNCFVQVDGCTDPTANNYDASANTDDGTCTYDVFGCTDATALNYDASANTDDGSCIYCVDGCMDATQFNYDANATCDDGSCIPYTYGCTDSSATNYNSTVNTDDGSCIWLGCMDATADNYDATATVDDGSCTYTPVSGCTDPAADNYDATATVDDGSCTYTPVSGCTDPTADNYDATATVDDGSCTYTVCTSPSPTGAYVTELTHDRVRFNWDDMNSSTCMVEQYRVRYREVGTSAWSSKTMSGSGLCQFGLGTTSKMTLNLLSSTTYEYYMKAWYCGGSSSGWSALQNFTTEDDCQNIVNFTVSTPTTTKADFAWDTVSAYSFVRLQLRVDTTGSTWFTAGGFGVFYPALTKSKNGLVSGESYRAAARTWCNPNGGPYRSATWSTPIFWTQPTSVRIDGGAAIANLDVYPNPSRDVFNVAFTSEDVQDLEVRVINVVGEVVYTENLQQFVGEYTKSLDLESYTKGVYFLEITTNSGVVNKKLILQ